MFIRKLSLIVLMLLTLSVVSKAQEIGTLRGLVTDSTTTEVLPFGNVFIKELSIGASTDSRGYFLITSIPAGRNYTLVVSYVGYKTKTLTVKITANKVTHYDIEMVPADIQLQTIENHLKLYPRESKRIFSEVLNIYRVSNLPVTFRQNIMCAAARAIKTLYRLTV